MFDLGSTLDLVSAGLGLFSGIKQSNAAKSSSKSAAASTLSTAAANAKISEYDATVAEQDADQIRYNTEVALQIHQKMVDRFSGAQKARYAKSGVVLSSGSPLDVMVESAADAKLDHEMIKYQGETAEARQRSLAERYRMLADAGLRDAAAQAAQIEQAGADRSYAYLISGTANFLSNLNDLWQ